MALTATFERSHKGLIAWWARNPVAANLLMLMCVVAGLLGYQRMSKELFPGIELDIVSISVSWPGASPAEMEDQIVIRIEEEIADAANVRIISAYVTEGFARVSVDMRDGANFTDFLNDIKGRVDGISTFPQEAFPPVISRIQPSFDVAWFMLYADNEGQEKELNDISREIRKELAALKDGSPLMRVFGQRREEVSIEVSELNLQRHQLTFDDVVRAIRLNSINLSSGNIRTESGSFQLSVRNLADDQSEFERIVIRQNPDGSLITVGDVATVLDGFEDRDSYLHANGKTARGIMLFSPEDFNIEKFSKAINTYTEDKQKDLPEGIHFELMVDMADAYYGRMNLVGGNAVTGLILVLIILILFLQPMVAFWVAVGIGVSFIGAFTFLPMIGVSLNLLSMFGFLLVIGIVVDDAIVVGENIHRQVEQGKSGVDAAITGTQLVAKPVFFAVLTTMIAFAPFLLVRGGGASFTQAMSATIIFALFFSLVESFLILPAHLSHLKPEMPDNIFFRAQRKIADSLIWFAQTKYRPAVLLCLKHRYVTICAFIMAFALSVALLMQGWLNYKFFPNVESDFVFAEIVPQEGTPFSRNEEIAEQFKWAVEEIRREAQEKFGVDPILDSVTFVDEEDIGGFFSVRPADERGFTLKELATNLREKIGEIPDLQSIEVDYSIGGLGGLDISFDLFSQNPHDLRAATRELKAFLRSIAGTYDVQSALRSEKEEIRINLKPGAERLGVTYAMAANQVRQAFYGEEVQRLPRGGEDVRVMVRYPKSARREIESLETLRLRPNGGAEIPIGAVVDVSYAPTNAEIRRRNRQRTNNIGANVLPGFNAKRIERKVYDDFVPSIKQVYPSVSFGRAGGAEDEVEFMQNLGPLLIIALFAMYILVAIAFGSYFQPILIMSSIPFAFMGGVFGHVLWGVELAMFSYLGIAAAAGVVINDNLVLVDTINRKREIEGAGAIEALIEAGVERFRPIFLTSLTTFIGLVPILLETSFDALFLRPTIVSVTFGIFFALFVTLFFVPALYAVGVDLNRLLQWDFAYRKQRSLAMARGEPIPEREALVKLGDGASKGRYEI